MIGPVRRGMSLEHRLAIGFDLSAYRSGATWSVCEARCAVSQLRNAMPSATTRPTSIPLIAE